MLVGALGVLVSMIFFGVDANEPIYVGLVLSVVVYLAVSLLTPRTDAATLTAWRDRVEGSRR